MDAELGQWLVVNTLVPCCAGRALSGGATAAPSNTQGPLASPTGQFLMQSMQTCNTASTEALK